MSTTITPSSPVLHHRVWVSDEGSYAIFTVAGARIVSIRDRGGMPVERLYARCHITDGSTADEIVAEVTRVWQDGPECDGYEAEVTPVYSPHMIPAHIASLGEEARQDIAYGRWDPVGTDRLYAACGATEPQHMMSAKLAARDVAREQIAAK